MLSLIIGEYLRNLKERKELDILFVLLLEQMGFRLLKSAQSSQGQPEYGNDITAIKGNFIYIFQLKAGGDAKITSQSLTKRNGIFDSIIQAKYVDFKDLSKPNLKDKQKRIIIIHNGEIDSNANKLLNGFIEKEFNNENECERWDIFKLTELFSKYLFNEYFLVNREYQNLLKKTLAFIDVPENDFSHFKILISNMLKDFSNYTPKKIRKLISTFSIIAIMILHYSKESNNLEPAKECLTFTVLRTWGWILENKHENKIVVKREFFKLCIIHFQMMEELLSKTILIAKGKDGLFSERGGHFEQIGYPLRSFEYIGYLIYHSYSYHYYFGAKIDIVKMRKNFVILIKELIENNSSFFRPILDNHSIPILMIVKFLIENEETDYAVNYIKKVLNNVALIKKNSHRLPELRNNLDSLIEFCATNNKPENYIDSSSYLINILFEISVSLEKQDIFNEYWEFFSKNELRLLTYFPPENIVENEHIIFQKELFEEGSTDVYNEFNPTIDENLTNYEKFKMKVKKNKKIKYQTDNQGFGFLRKLAHLYYKTPFFPDEWRNL